MLTSHLNVHISPFRLAFNTVYGPSVALGLIDKPFIEVILIGGRLYKHSIVTVGAAAIEGISNIHADIFFMGVTGVHPEAGLTTGDYEEACIKRALSGRAAERQSGRDSRAGVTGKDQHRLIIRYRRPGINQHGRD